MNEELNIPEEERQAVINILNELFGEYEIEDTQRILDRVKRLGDNE